MGMHIGHVAMRVVDLERAVRYAQAALGLRETARGDGVAYLTANEKHHELELIAADAGGFDHVGLEVESRDELAATTDRAVAAGGVVLERRGPGAGLGDRVLLEGPDGIVYELYVAMERAGLARDAYHRSVIRRFGHLTFEGPDPRRSVDFWVDGLGFRIADELDGIYWLRCDVDHHGLAIGPRDGELVLHHHAWEVQDLGMLGQYCDGLAEHDLHLVWGPVRHGPGFNIATYMIDPDGLVVEVYTDMLKIYDEAAYVPIDWNDDRRALDLWGEGPTDGMRLAGAPVLEPRR